MVREVKSQYRAHRDVGLAAAAAKSKSSKPPRSHRHDPSSSRAPVSAPEAGSSSKDNSAPSAKEAQLDAIHASLTALGAPPVSRDDLARLHQGPFGEALGFFVEHVVGREEARRARRGIAAHVSRLHATGGLRTVSLEDGEGDGENVYVRQRRAQRRLSDAERELDSVRKDMDKAQKGVQDFETQVEQLQADLRGKRVANMLLSVLEKKEKIRKKRIEEIGTLLEQLRISVQNQETSSSAEESPPPEPVLPIQQPLHVDHVQDTLATLHGYHVRLSQLASASDGSSSRELEARLLASIAAKLGKAEDDPDVRDTFQRCCVEARRKADARLRYVSPLPGNMDHVDLDAIAEQLAEKEDHLQQAEDEITALEASCSESMRALATFRNSTVPILKMSLEEDTKATNNYVDALRRSVENECALAATRGKPAVSSRTLEATVSELESVIRSDHERRTFLRAVSPHGRADAAETAAAVAKFREQQDGTDERLSRLLGRKVGKSRLGEGLVRDIEVLVKEVDLVANVL